MAVREQKNRKQVGKKIQKVRKSVGYSQEELAEKLHISRTHMGHVEQGRKSPSLDLLGKIAAVLRVNLKDLFS